MTIVGGQRQDGLDSRIEHLERRVRWLAGSLVLVGVAMSACLVSAFQGPDAGTHRAREFAVVDDAGLVRARLGLDERGNVALRLMNAKCVARATLEVVDRPTPDGSPTVSLALARADGAPTIELQHEDWVQHGDVQTLRFSSGLEEPSLWIASPCGMDGTGAVVQMFSADGDPIVDLSSGWAGESPHLVLRTPPRDSTSPFGAHPGAAFYCGDNRMHDAGAHLNLAIKHGENTVELVTHDGGPTELVLKAPDGKAAMTTKP